MVHLSQGGAILGVAPGGASCLSVGAPRMDPAVALGKLRAEVGWEPLLPLMLSQNFCFRSQKWAALHYTSDGRQVRVLIRQ